MAPALQRRWPVYACPICTKPGRHRALCEPCAAELWRKREPTTRELGAYQTHGLFAWRRDDWRGLRWWAAALKGKEDPVFWREAAVWLTDVFGQPTAGTTFVPIPGTRGRNHARGLATALAEFTGAPVADVLNVVAKRGHQRRLGLFARRGRRYGLVDEPPRGPVIVVDDVITSGATIEAAFRALRQPPEFRAWCVMDRRPPTERGTSV